MATKREKVKNLVRFTDKYETKEQIILRDHLALQRTKLANERTLLSYVRSSIYLIIAGIAFIQMPQLQDSSYVGEVCIFVSVIILIIGITRFYQLKKQLNSVYKKEPNE